MVALELATAMPMYSFSSMMLSETVRADGASWSLPTAMPMPENPTLFGIGLDRVFRTMERLTATVDPADKIAMP